MADDSNSATSFKAWALGIIGTVIGTVLIFEIEQYLTRPPPAPIVVNGRVVDKNSNQLLQNVTVLLTVQEQSSSDTTDSEGRYSFALVNANNSASGLLKASAPGYQEGTRNFFLSQPSIDDLQLTPVGSSPARNYTGLKATTMKYMVRPNSVQFKIDSAR
jgi:hypothetical protein